MSREGEGHLTVALDHRKSICREALYKRALERVASAAAEWCRALNRPQNADAAHCGNKWMCMRMCMCVRAYLLAPGRHVDRRTLRLVAPRADLSGGAWWGVACEWWGVAYE